MLVADSRQAGSDHWIVDYWEQQLGNDISDRKELDAKSPARFAEHFTAPVLLLHGKHDIVVPLHQSTIMYKALRKAGKDVTLTKLAGEDHYLSRSETRLEALRLIDEFLREKL